MEKDLLVENVLIGEFNSSFFSFLVISYQ